MKKPLSPQEILETSPQLKADFKFVQKMLKTGYKEEVRRLKTMEKTLKPFLNSKTPVTEGDTAVAVTAFYRELGQMLATIHQNMLFSFDSAFRNSENNLMIQYLASIMAEFARESNLQSVQKKVKKLQKFQNDIIKKTKQKAAKRAAMSKETPWYIR